MFRCELIWEIPVNNSIMTDYTGAIYYRFTSR